MKAFLNAFHAWIDILRFVFEYVTCHCWTWEILILHLNWWSWAFGDANGILKSSTIKGKRTVDEEKWSLVWLTNATTISSEGRVIWPDRGREVYKAERTDNRPPEKNARTFRVDENGPNKSLYTNLGVGSWQRNQSWVSVFDRMSIDFKYANERKGIGGFPLKTFTFYIIEDKWPEEPSLMLAWVNWPKFHNTEDQ